MAKFLRERLQGVSQLLLLVLVVLPMLLLYIIAVAVHSAADHSYSIVIAVSAT